MQHFRLAHGNALGFPSPDVGNIRHYFVKSKQGPAIHICVWRGEEGRIGTAFVEFEMMPVSPAEISGFLLLVDSYWGEAWWIPDPAFSLHTCLHALKAASLIIGPKMTWHTSLTVLIRNMTLFFSAAPLPTLLDSRQKMRWHDNIFIRQLHLLECVNLIRDNNQGCLSMAEEQKQQFAQKPARRIPVYGCSSWILVQGGKLPFLGSPKISCINYKRGISWHKRAARLW